MALALILPAVGFINTAGGRNVEEEILEAPGRTIHLKYADFDPLSRLPAIPEQLMSRTPFIPNTKMPFIVQTDGQMTEAWVEELSRNGAEIISYIPDHAYLVRATEDDASQIMSLGNVRWMGEYHPAYKLDTKLYNAVGTMEINVNMFQDATNTYVVKLAKMVGAEVTTLTKSDQVNVVRLKIDAIHFSTLAAMPEVRFMSLYEPEQIMNAGTTQFVQSGSRTGGRPIHDKGIRGQNQIISVGDSGLRHDHQNFLGSVYPGNKVIANYVPGNSVGVLGENMGHGSHCSGTALGDGPSYGAYDAGTRDGHAFMARLVFLDMGNDAEQNAIYTPSDYYENLFQIPEETYGAKFSSNSWGGGEAYDERSAQIDRYVWDSQDFTILFAQGNDGSNAPVGAQAQCKNVISVGGTDNAGTGYYASSTYGPTPDGRIKPDVIAPAVNIDSVNSGGTTVYTTMSGTSMACPAGAGTAALVRQYYSEGWYPTGAQVTANGFNPSAALIKATLINGADPISTTQVPNNREGWGRIHLENSLYFSGDTIRTAVVDTDFGLLTGDYVEYAYSVQTGTRLKISLVYTDYEGDPAASKMLVNDLDLRVTAPGGTIYRGNVFSGAWSTTGGTHDNTNNVEAVNLQSPAAGVYTVRISAPTVARGPQNFALVVSGALTPGYGNVFIDRTVYGDGDNIYIDVEDTNNAAASVTVTLTTSSGDSETVTIPGTGPNSGLFKGGTIQTGLGYPLPDDGTLQVFHGDIITVTYSDTDPAHDAIAMAHVDLRGPMISDVYASGIMGTAAIINWKTDQNANSNVHYGTSPDSALWTNTTTMTALSLNHKVVLKDLSPDTVYYYDVESMDSRGRSTRDNNGGDHYVFSTPSAATGGNLVLLVDKDDGTTSPLSGMGYEVDWINNLNHYGWTFTHWDFKVYGTPSLNDMNSHQIVVWFVAEGYPQVNSDDRAVLGEFLDQTVNPQTDNKPMLLLSGQDIGWDLGMEGTDTDVAWLEYYTRSRYMGDDADGGGGTEGGTFPQFRGTNPFRIMNLGHPLNIYGYTDIDLEEDCYGASGRFWPDDLLLLPGGGSARAWNYNNHAYGGDSAAVSQTAAGTGAQSRVVFQGFAHDMISTTNNGPNDYRPHQGYIDPQRAGMLDQTLQWLLGGNKPSITLTYPTGGETLSGNVNVQWTVTGANKIDVYYSPNGGQLWNTLATGLAGTATSHNWDTSSLIAGSDYVVKVVATGSADFADLTDYSEAYNLIIQGIDNKGPGCVAGSVTVDPMPVLQGQTIEIKATISDMGKGESDVVAAEYFIDTTGDPGTGQAMGVDGTVGITTQFTHTNSSASSVIGDHTVYVHGMDSEGNWGLFSSEQYTVIAGAGDQPPYGPILLSPGHDSAGVSLNPTLQVTVTCPQSETMNVRFYNADGDVLLTTLFNVPSGSSPSYAWSGREELTTYQWYVTAENSIGTRKSSTWSFTTGVFTPPDAPVLNVDHYGPGSVPGQDFTETRWMSHRTHVINDLDASRLSLEAGNTNMESTANGGNRGTVSVGVRVFVRSESGANTELTNGVEAIASTGASALISATWNAPQTPLQKTDAIAIMVYLENVIPPTVLHATFVTEQLNSDQLDAATWTLYYQVQRANPNRFRWGTEADRPSRIENFRHSIAEIPGDPLWHNTLNWTHDGSKETTNYNIYRSDAQIGTYNLIDTVPVGTNTYVDLDMGQADAIRWWYKVRAVNSVGEEQNDNAVPEPFFEGPVLEPYDIPIPATGWVYVSFPYAFSGDIQTILDDSVHGTGGTTWSVAKGWDNQNKIWTTYRAGYASTLSTINNQMGVWLYITATDGNLTTGATGDFPTASVSIQLRAGWNMVGYPSSTSRLASETLPTPGTLATIVSEWQAASPYVQDYSNLASVTMTHGKAYWVHVTADCLWTVDP